MGFYRCVLYECLIYEMIQYLDRTLFFMLLPLDSIVIEPVYKKALFLFPKSSGRQKVISIISCLLGKKEKGTILSVRSDTQQ